MKIKNKSIYKTKRFSPGWAGCFILMLLAVSMGFAQDSAFNTGHVEGVIYKKDGKTPLKDARIILEQMEKNKKTGRVYRSNITDESGEYRLGNIPEGFYKGKIMTGKKRYKIKRVDFYVHVIRDETNYLSFSLKKKGRP